MAAAVAAEVTVCRRVGIEDDPLVARTAYLVRERFVFKAKTETVSLSRMHMQEARERVRRCFSIMECDGTSAARLARSGGGRRLATPQPASADSAT